MSLSRGWLCHLIGETDGTPHVCKGKYPNAPNVPKVGIKQQLSIMPLWKRKLLSAVEYWNVDKGILKTG